MYRDRYISTRLFKHVSTNSVSSIIGNPVLITILSSKLNFPTHQLHPSSDPTISFCYPLCHHRHPSSSYRTGFPWTHLLVQLSTNSPFLARKGPFWIMNSLYVLFFQLHVLFWLYVQLTTRAVLIFSCLSAGLQEKEEKAIYPGLRNYVRPR